MFAVDVSELEKRFNRRQGGRREAVIALAKISFTVARGECVAVIGQNGSGKSTLVRALSTLILPDGGSAGEVWPKTPAFRPWYSAPSPWALSKYTGMPWRSPTLVSASMSGGRPYT